ncbi:MAG: GNAT family N-acetyltransferase [Nitrospirae bacterium]|nr:GNAT family N-acetyltransferase [Nitrospirota bacterium]
MAILSSQIEMKLKDGTPVGLSLVDRSSKECLKKGFERLSERSRYLRFFTPMKSLSEAQLAFLADIDQVNHAAIGAYEVKDEGNEGIGIARYFRSAGEPDVAEFAVTVVDEYQNRGVGAILMEFLVQHARENGIRVLRGYVLPENLPMIGLLERYGASGQREEDGTLCFDLVLKY